MDVVPGTEYPYHCTAPTGHTECHSQYGVSGCDRSIGLETRPKHIQEDQPDTRSPEDRPVCDKGDNTVQSLARSLCRSSRLLLLQDWSQVRGYANPPWCLVGKVLAQVQSQQAHIVLVAPVWKTQPWYPMLLSMLVHSEPDSRGHGRSTPANTRHTASRMEHLRQRYREQELSEKATSLMLKSWRTKTNKSYDTLFTKWHGWCTGRDIDSFSGPVNNVVNF